MDRATKKVGEFVHRLRPQLLKGGSDLNLNVTAVNFDYDMNSSIPMCWLLSSIDDLCHLEARPYRLDKGVLLR